MNRILAVAVFVLLRAEAKPREYESAEVVDVHEAPGGVQFEVMGQRCRYTAFLKGSGRRPLAAEGDEIRYAVEGKAFYLVDRAGRRFKMRWLEQALMPPPMPLTPKLQGLR